MSQETKSPGMRALEAMDFYVFHHGLRLAGLPKDRDTARKEIAAIIERETGVTELQENADELAKALEDMMTLQPLPEKDCNAGAKATYAARRALAAYRKDKPL